MKLYKRTVVVTGCLATITCMGCLILEFIVADFAVKGFWVDFLIGVFSSALLITITAIISYIIEKKKRLTSFSNVVNCINLKLVSIYDFFRPGNVPDVEIASRMVNELFDFLMNNLHLPIFDIDFFVTKTKGECLIKEIDAMICDLYYKVEQLNKLYWQMKLKIINEQTWYDKFAEFASWLRQYGEDGQMYINEITEKHKKLLELYKITYDREFIGEVRAN